jgi:hypothetical protein
MKSKSVPWEMKIASVLGTSSLVLYLLHFECFGNLHIIWQSMLTSLAFLPISVMVVTIFIDRLLKSRDRAMRREKRHMLVSVFFSNLGTRLLRCISNADPAVEDLHKQLGNAEGWQKIRVNEVERLLSAHAYKVRMQPHDLEAIRALLTEKADFLLRLLENPSLLEHEGFTGLLRAIFHLNDELSLRGNLNEMTDADCRHLAGDVRRVYEILTREWVEYLRYLELRYPYLLSLAVRTNPFNPHASPVVQ